MCCDCVRYRVPVLIGCRMVFAIRWHARLRSDGAPDSRLQGLYATGAISAGVTICEYAGESVERETVEAELIAWANKNASGILDVGFLGGPFLTGCSASCRPTRDVCPDLLSIDACRMLIGACNPMLCPFHVFRQLRPCPAKTGAVPVGGVGGRADQPGRQRGRAPPGARRLPCRLCQRSEASEI